MKGFSIVELLVVMAIFTIICGAIFASLSSGNVLWDTGSNQARIEQEVRKSVEKIYRELKETSSSRVTIGGGGTSITFQVPVDSDNDGDIIDDSGQVEWGVNTITYLRGGTNNLQLIRRSGGIDTILANDISALTFTGVPAVNPTVVRISVTAQKTTLAQRSLTSTLTSQVQLRN